jgi:hypothetical protein
VQAAQLPLGFFYFFLDKKVTKNQVNRHLLLCRTGLCPAISQNHGLQYFALLAFPQTLASAKFANALSITQATIILTDFARSWSVDRVHLVLLALLNDPE